MPKIKGIKSGEKIINNVDSNEITSAISNLDNSYLYIQGPPGTGKSTYSAKVDIKSFEER